MADVTKARQQHQHLHLNISDPNLQGSYTPSCHLPIVRSPSEGSTVSSIPDCREKKGLFPAPPAEEWVFLPPSVPPPSTSTPQPSTPVHLPTPFSSSSSPPFDVEKITIAGTYGYGPMALFGAEFCSTLISMPFEVGKTLLQIEYRPRRKFAPVDPTLVEDTARRGSKSEELEVEDEDEAASYFSDRLSSETYLPPPEQVMADIPVDESGYINDPEPTWLLKDDFEISRGNGVWGMIRRIRYTPSEGLPALWKAQIITTIHSLISNILQPTIYLSLLEISPPVNKELPLAALPQPAIPLGLQVASHLLTHLLLSPMEVLRTRIIAMPSHSSTPSSISLFNRMVTHEGGLSSMYLHPNLLFPAVIEHTLRPLLTLSIPILIERQLGIPVDISPITYSICDLSLNLASLIVLLPIETVRRRLQVQSRGSEKEKIRTVVKTREKEYVGMVEAMWRIVTEETGVRRRRVMSEKDEGGTIAGLRQLYRGVSSCIPLTTDD